MKNPVIILVNPQLPENIGATARAMKNFGLKELRVVAPREKFPSKRTYDLASHAADIIDNAKLFETTRESIEDIKMVYAATARSREMVKPVFAPPEATVKMVKENVKTAILFGPERTGLSNEDVTAADRIITIPTASEMTSLNIAQSVVVIAYQWLLSSSKSSHKSFTPAKSALATKKELQGFFDHLERRLDEVDFWKVYEKKNKMWMNVQNIFMRANLTEQEVRTLHGIIAAFK